MALTHCSRTLSGHLAMAPTNLEPELYVQAILFDGEDNVFANLGEAVVHCANEMEQCVARYGVDMYIIVTPTDNNGGIKLKTVQREDLF